MTSETYSTLIFALMVVNLTIFSLIFVLIVESYKDKNASQEKINFLGCKD